MRNPATVNLEGARRLPRAAAGLAVVVLLAGCGGSAATESPSAAPATPEAMEPTASPSPAVIATPSPTPVDDPATARVEVQGSGTSVQLQDAVGTSVDGVQQNRNGIWKNTMSMSDPRVSVETDMVLNMDLYPDGSGIWWGTETDAVTGWEGITVGVIRSDGVHEGDLAYLGTGPSAGRELRLHQYMGPGADTSAGDEFELTGWHDTIDIPGWTFDPAPALDPTARIADLVKAWDAGNGAAAAALYARAATLVDATGSSVTGRDAIAALVTEAAGSGIHRELVDAVLVRGNYAIAGVQLTEGGHDTIQMVVLRFDDDGLVVQQEVIGS